MRDPEEPGRADLPLGQDLAYVFPGVPAGAKTASLFLYDGAKQTTSPPTAWTARASRGRSTAA